MLWAIALAAQGGGNEQMADHSISPAYTNIETEAACGPHVARIRYRNEGPPGRRGLVRSVSIDGREVQGAAAALQDRAGNRSISHVGVMNCGYYSRNLLFWSIMELSTLESQRDGLPPFVFFQLKRTDGVWRITWETRELP